MHAHVVVLLLLLFNLSFIVQGRSILRLHNESQDDIKAAPCEATDIRRLLTSSLQTQNMTPKEFQVAKIPRISTYQAII